MCIPLGRGCENWLMAAVSEANHLSTGKYAPMATPPTTVARQPRLPPDWYRVPHLVFPGTVEPSTIG